MKQTKSNQIRCKNRLWRLLHKKALSCCRSSARKNDVTAGQAEFRQVRNIDLAIGYGIPIDAIILNICYAKKSWSNWLAGCTFRIAIVNSRYRIQLYGFPPITHTNTPILASTSALSASSAAISAMIFCGLRSATASPPWWFFTDRSQRGGQASVLVRQQQSGLRQQQTVRVELPLGDDPQAVLAVLDGLARVNGIGR